MADFRSRFRLALAAGSALGCLAAPASADPATGARASSAAPAAIAPTRSTLPLLQPVFEPVRRSWEQMVEDRLIRVLVVSNRTHFFLDGAQQRGITADALSELEEHLNRKLDLGARRLHVVPIPVHRDQLLPYLVEGRADMAAANLTITPERRAHVDFTMPTSKPLNEVIVTGPQAPPLSSLDDLSGQAIHVRRSSSFWSHLERLNEDLEERGLAPIEIIAAHEYLETEDLLEMTSSGVIPMTVADAPLATFWSDVLADLVARHDLKIAEGERIGWAIRKDATGLKQHLDPWIRANREGRLLGNMLLKRYLRNNRWVRTAPDPDEEKRLAGILELFQIYGERYRFDWLLVAAQGYQESGLRQSKRSHAGAIGVMQVLPSTARDSAVGIENIEELEPNIHAGTRYLRHLVDTYFVDPGIDAENQLLFAFAAYNAGPTRIRRLRRQAADEGLDPNVWFGNVELVVARTVGRETIQYVANIYKYYVAFDLTMRHDEERREAHAKLREAR